MGDSEVSPQADGPSSSEPFTEQREKERPGSPGFQLLLSAKSDRGSFKWGWLQTLN